MSPPPPPPRPTPAVCSARPARVGGAQAKARPEGRAVSRMHAADSRDWAAVAGAGCSLVTHAIALQDRLGTKQDGATSSATTDVSAIARRLPLTIDAGRRLRQVTCDWWVRRADFGAGGIREPNLSCQRACLFWQLHNKVTLRHKRPAGAPFLFSCQLFRKQLSRNNK